LTKKIYSFSSTVLDAETINKEADNSGINKDADSSGIDKETDSSDIDKKADNSDIDKEAVTVRPSGPVRLFAG